MPFRTKDFLLFIVAVGFLVLGITGTVVSDIAQSSGGNVAAVNFVIDTTIFEAELSEPAPTLNRAEQLATLRAAVGERLATLLGSDSSVGVEPEPVVTAPVQAVLPDSTEPLLCPDYEIYAGAWSTTNLNFEVVEGARLLFRELPAQYEIDPISLEPVLMPNREFILQLPLQYYRADFDTCLPSDVVGVALDGSLIRNNEATMYRIFTEATHIGYALDGFPIYGVTTDAVDTCGGHSRSGEYRYFLQPDRATIINCFAGSPVTLP